jgi:hypothetical protein
MFNTGKLLVHILSIESEEHPHAAKHSYTTELGKIIVVDIELSRYVTTIHVLFELNGMILKM